MKCFTFRVAIIDEYDFSEAVPGGSVEDAGDGPEEDGPALIGGGEDHTQRWQGVCGVCS